MVDSCVEGRALAERKRIAVKVGEFADGELLGTAN
jgi:hypothetical protein